MFQKTVNRNYTTCFPGDIVRDGPYRAKPGRIVSPNVGTDPGLSTNHISRAFGYVDENAEGNTGTTFAADAYDVTVGGANFFGILGHPKHYALYGDANGALDPSMDLPQFSNAEFFDMVTGMVVELFNEQAAAKTVTYGDQLAYAPSTITGAQNPNKLPYGALISVPANSAAPAGFELIPNAKIVTSLNMAASSTTNLVLTYVIVQLTQ